MTSHEDLCNCRIIHHDRVAKAREEALPSPEVENLCQIFKALADGSRMRILRALTEDEMCVCDLAALLGITESAVSHQLRLLRTLGLVRNRREGAILYYRSADEHVSQLIRVALEHVRE